MYIKWNDANVYRRHSLVICKDLGIRSVFTCCYLCYTNFSPTKKKRSNNLSIKCLAKFSFAKHQSSVKHQTK